MSTQSSVSIFISPITLWKFIKKPITGVIYDPSVLAPSQSWRIYSSCFMDGSAHSWVGMTTEGHGPTPWRWKGDGQLVRLEVWLAGIMSISKNILPVVRALISDTCRCSCTSNSCHLGEGFELHWRKGPEGSTRCVSWSRSVWVPCTANSSEHRQHQFPP